MGVTEWFFNHTWVENTLKKEIREQLKLMDSPLTTATEKIKISRRILDLSTRLHEEFCE